MRRIIILTISLLLIVFSISPLYLMGQEVLFQQKVSNQYKIETIYHPMDMTTDSFHQLHYLQDGTMKSFPEMKRAVYLNGKEISDYSAFDVMNGLSDSEKNQLSRIISFYETDIALIDTFTRIEGDKVREKGQVEILINGTNYAEPVNVEIRPTYLDNNRYHGYLGMLKMTNLSTNEEELIIIQRLFEDFVLASEKEFSWKTISINNEGEVKTDIFTRDDIDNPAYRKDLINKATVSPYALGFRSNLLHSYPSLFYPFLYPFGTMLLGVMLLILGIVLKR